MNTRELLARIVPKRAKAVTIEPQDGTPGKEIRRERLFTSSQWQLMWWRFRKHRMAMISIVVLALAYLVAAFCEFVAPHDPNRAPSFFARIEKFCCIPIRA